MQKFSIVLKMFFLLLSAPVLAQGSLSASIDTARIKIGAEVRLSLRATADTASRVVFPSAKAFGALEVIRSYKVDTVQKGTTYELLKRYGLTQFDSGRYSVPRLKVVIGNKSFFTDSLAVEVLPVAVDTLKQKMFDIRDIIDTGDSALPWWAWLLIAGAGLGAMYYGWLYLKKHRSNKQSELIYKSPIEKAHVLLQQLETRDLLRKGEIKTYYSELTNIARNYLEEAIHIPAMESTTSELIAALREAAVKKKMDLSAETVADLENVLRHADLVKFARSTPPEDDIADDRRKIEKSIFTLDKSIPEEEPVDTAAIQARQKEIQQQKQRKQLVTASAIVVGVLFVFLGILSAAKGFGYVKDLIVGNPVKELLDGQWIASEYGSPAVYIETPRVLERLDAQQYLPKETVALLKEFQMFGFGKVGDDVFVLVSTHTYKGEVQIQLEKAVEGTLGMLEANGAGNILVKQEKWETREGISGVKAYGNLSVGKDRMYYEIIVFGQQNGLQQIVVVHADQNQYGEELRNRILNSVELKQAQP
jgi:hypothetical protein